jgi:hypothetical protein
VSKEIVAALIGAVAALAAAFIPILREFKRRRAQKYKFVYVRIVHLHKVRPGTEPVCRAYVKRLGESIDVFDEFHLFRLNIFHHPRTLFTCKDRTSGAVDIQILHPWQESLHFPDRGASELRGYVEQAINKPSSVFLTKSMYYNALQAGHEDIAMRIEEDTDEARLMVDFSSLPAHEAMLLEAPVGYLRGEDDEEVAVGVAKPYAGVYSISYSDMKKGQVIRMELKIAWDKLERQAEIAI